MIAKADLSKHSIQDISLCEKWKKWGWLNAETDFPQGLWSVHLWTCSGPSWMWSWVTGCNWPRGSPEVLSSLNCSVIYTIQDNLLVGVYIMLISDGHNIMDVMAFFYTKMLVKYLSAISIWLAGYLVSPINSNTTLPSKSYRNVSMTAVLLMLLRWRRL